tara:strand:- start:59992 stop:60276 length:285 start_codon:yes stop_codon:yes gene_type:complete
MKAVGNRIILIKDKPNEMEGSIWVPKKDVLHAPPYVGTIVCMGPRVNDADFKIGSRITFHDVAGVEILLGTSKFLSIRDIDVTSVICSTKIEIS